MTDTPTYQRRMSEAHGDCCDALDAAEGSDYATDYTGALRASLRTEPTLEELRAAARAGMAATGIAGLLRPFTRGAK